MRYKVELEIEVDSEHPGINSNGEAFEAIEDFIASSIFEDDYMSTIECYISKVD